MTDRVGEAHSTELMMEVLQPLTRMAHGKTIQKEKGAYKFFPTNGSLLTTQFLKGDSVMDEYISLAGELRLAETVCRYGGKDNFADLLKRAAERIEELEYITGFGVNHHESQD